MRGRRGVWMGAAGLLLALSMAAPACATRPAPEAAAQFSVSDVSPAEALAVIEERRPAADFVILDVRTPAEFADGRIEGAVNVDLNAADFRSRLSGLDRRRVYLVYCRSGNRSRAALKVMGELGFQRAYHLASGILGWQAAGLPVVQ